MSKKKIEVLEASKQKLLGEKLESCSLEELHELEGTIEQSLRSIRGRKASRLLNISYHLLREKISQLKEKESSLVKENALLHEQYKQLLELPSAASKEVAPCTNLDRHTEVETELRIGFPGRETHGM
ncbi:hypothetical protein B296_00048307 [Ensete ventricosum]|uniref:K-box domain-containing protein n=1 Tax=Ensete ventricosum TaxID=4639 RepID=A0A426X599_ENSVE|nr:hypothetical protein B296_00048307 [Ensete ventricosum]